MAKAFVRIDLSEKGQFFRPVALEPGCPLYDPTNANDRILFRWFRGMTPEPEWDETGEVLHFYIRNDQGGRLEDVTCVPVTDEDLNVNLTAEIERLQLRVDAIRATSTTEKILHEKLAAEFHDLIDSKTRPDRTYYFFKYQDGAGLWRLVWIPGYAPIHQEFGTPMICDDDACNQLYVRLPGAKPRCPICLKVPTARRKAQEAARKRRNRYMILLLILLLLGWVIWNQFRLKVVPGPWNAVVGATTEFRVITPGLDGFGLILSKDVTNEVTRLPEDPSIVSFPGVTTRALACSPGQTKVRFYNGFRWKTILVTVTAPVNPKRVWIEPESVALVPGSTQRIRLMGEYEDGSVADLSRSTAWNSMNDGTVYAYNGFLEGLKPGASKVTAQYRATPKDKWLPATAQVKVATAKIAKLEVTFPTGSNLPLGKDVDLTVTGTTADGAKYFFAGSSRLATTVDPPALGTYHGEFLSAQRPGTGRFSVSLLDGTPEGKTLLNAVSTINIVSPKTKNRLRVYPLVADLAVDQMFPLSIVCADESALKVTSSDAKIVRVLPGGRLVGCSSGSAEVTVTDGAKTVVVPVTVSAVQPDALVMYPPVATVPVDHDAKFEFYARAGADRYYAVSEDAVKLASRPNSEAAAFDSRKFALRGYSPLPKADGQRIQFTYQGQVSESAPVTVIPAPMRLQITPSGKVALPLGLCMTFDGFATYGDGVSTLVPYTRMEWNSNPLPADVEGFDFVNGKAMALDVGAGPVTLWGKYLGTESNRAEVTTVERTDVQLAIEVDRTLRIAGEPGMALLSGKTKDGDVELVPNLGTFTTTVAETLTPIDEHSGAYKAVAPGVATLSATHPAAENPATVDMRVVHPRNAKIFWEPSEVNVAVGEMAPFELKLEGTNPDAAEGEESIWTVPMNSPGVYYSFAQPESVDWRSPHLAGLLPAESFDVSASFLPYLKSAAHARVSVFKSEAPAALRVVPSEITLAPGQSLPLAVEEQLKDSEVFEEVQPDAVQWDVPLQAYWRGPEGVIRPTLTVPEDAKDGFTLTAKYRGKTAECRVTIAAPTLNPADPEVELFVKRQPEGRLLPVGQKQSYSIWMRKGEVEEPAPSVQWTPNFENESVAWGAPVLEAFKPGVVQWLQAKIGNRAVRFYTQTMDPFVPGERPAPREGEPSAVRLLSNSGDVVSMPVGGKYVDYRVEAEYPDGFVEIVTKDATLHPIAGDKSVVSPSNTELQGVKPGTVTFLAEYKGVDSEEPNLTVNVTEGVDIDELRLEPTKDIRMLPNETVQFKLHGYKEGKSVGLLTHMDGIVWKSSDPTIATTQGNTATSVALGKTDITAEFQSVTSAPAGVEVVATIDEKLGPTDNVIKMMVGESRLVGKDFALIRGNVDFSMQCHVTPLVPGICEYDATRHALVGRSPGATDVIFTMADKKAVMRVVVGGVDQETLNLLREDGEIVIEPANVTLSSGQATELRVYAVSKKGGVRLERTASAVFRTDNADVVEVRGLQLCAKTPGSAVITVTIPEIASKSKAGSAMVTVNDQPITELSVEPGAIQMSVGDTSNVFIQGRSASGQYPLYAQPRLKVNVDGASVKMNGIQTVEAIAAGASTLNIDWDGKVKRAVTANVDDNPYSSLAIDPLETTVAVGEGRAYQVTALRGGRLYVLQPENGLELSTADPNIAAVQGNMVFGKSVGQTKVYARFAGMTSEGVLNVVEPGTVPVNVESAYVDPNAAVTYRPADTILDGGYVGVTSTDVFGEGYTTDTYLGERVAPYVVTDGYTVGGVPTGLRFSPDTMRLAKTSAPVPVQVYEQLADGRLGRDVSNDPNLVLSTTSGVVELARTPNGPYTVKPTGKEGIGRVSATMGDAAALSLSVQVGDVAVEGAQLAAFPSSIEMMVGNTMSLDAVRVIPSSGLMPFDVAYRMVPADSSGIVTVEAGNVIRANGVGSTRLQVSSVDVSGAYDNLTTYIPVNVSKPLQLSLTPMQHSMRVGETTPQFVMTALDETGRSFPVAAVLESMDPTILQPDPMNPGRFQAVSLGNSQIRATYGGQDLYATVSVGGERFLSVDGTMNEGSGDTFSVTLAVQASSQSGAIEYRVYEAGTPAPDNWVAGQATADGQSVMLASPGMPFRGRNEQYTLMIDSRSAGGTDIQSYPYNFRIGGVIKRVE